MLHPRVSAFPLTKDIRFTAQLDCLVPCSSVPFPGRISHFSNFASMHPSPPSPGVWPPSALVDDPGPVVPSTLLFESYSVVLRDSSSVEKSFPFFFFVAVSSASFTGFRCQACPFFSDLGICSCFFPSPHIPDCRIRYRSVDLSFFPNVSPFFSPIQGIPANPPFFTTSCRA